MKKIIAILSLAALLVMIASFAPTSTEAAYQVKCFWVNDMAGNPYYKCITISTNKFNPER